MPGSAHFSKKSYDYFRFVGQTKVNLHNYYFFRFQACEWLNFLNVIFQVQI